MAGVGSWVRRLLAIAFAVTVVVCLERVGPSGLLDLWHLFYGTPHERYAARLTWDGLADTEAGRAWLTAAERSLEEPAPAALAKGPQVSLDPVSGGAAAFVVTLRRGQRYVAEVRTADGQPPPLFLDVFERDDEVLRHVASAPAGEAALEMEVPSDGDYVLRLQAELHVGAEAAVAMRTEPTLRLPVARATGTDIHSFFGDLRDRGRRDHHGVDIFAPRGTPVVAASDGIVTSVGTNTLGGKIIWVARPGRREAHYYAHLDEQLVTVGTRVDAGDVIGRVGNTGNARTTAPHLHFGIYASGDAVDPLPYVSG